MSRFTLRLPDSLKEVLASRAEDEGVSLNQYLVYTLTKAAALESAAAQRRKFDELTRRFSDDEAEAALREMLNDRQ